MDTDPIKRPTFEGLLKLLAPAFGFGILLVLGIEIAFGEFDAYSIPIAISAWLFCIGFLFLLTRILSKIFGPMWDKYEKEQAAKAIIGGPTEPPERTVTKYPIRARWIVLMGVSNALIVAPVSGLLLGDLLLGVATGMVLASAAALMWVVLWLVSGERFKQSGLRW